MKNNRPLGLFVRFAKYAPLIFVLGLLLACWVWAQERNGWQDLQLSNNNSLSRLASYKYGRPFDLTNLNSGNAAFQLAFEEASGNILSEESSPVTLTAAGSPTYVQTTNGFYSKFHGIKFNANLDYFDNNAAISHLDLGTGDFTIEFVMKLSTTAQDSTVLYAFDATRHGWIIMLGGATNKTYFYFEATDGTSIGMTGTDMPVIFDNRIHKHRIYTTGRGAAGSLIYYVVDGVVINAGQSFDAGNGKSIPGGRALVGWNQSAAYKCDCTLYELRVTLTSTANSGGPGGG